MKKLLLIGFSLLLVPVFLFAQDSETVKIGEQVWTKMNLDLINFRNGDPIPLAQTEEEWIQAAENGKPMCVDFEFTWELGMIAGKLYNWYAVSDPRGLAPEGWHVPTDTEWNQLAEVLGGKEAATLKLKSLQGWEEGEGGSDESGFGGLPGGRIDHDGIFDEFGSTGYFWSSSESEGFGLNRNLDAGNSPFENAVCFKGYGLSVRLIKD